MVPIYDVGRQNSHHFFTMEFVEGGNLKDFITIRGKLSPEEATRCVRDMAEGLEYALRQGITHRDLKLTNVLMSTQGVAKLVDFGLAGNDGIAALGDDEASQRALEYAAIEKGTGVPDNDPRSDLFFLGAIYYELLTGMPPFPRTRSREERRRLTRYSNYRPLTDVEKNVPDDVDEIVGRLMTINANDRYQTPSELIADLRSAMTQWRTAGSEGVAEPDRPPTVLCVENRAKQQDILRKYLAKHGFRVLLLGDMQRALNRLQANPPDCVILMGQAIGDDVASAYDKVVQISRRTLLTGVVVLSTRQRHLEEVCRPTGATRVLVHPVTMQQLRKQVQQLLRTRNAAVDSFIIDDDTDESAVARV
ncbi:MAG: protein kinase [Planctomycetaceae bacterium]